MQIEASDAKNNFDALLERVQHGEEIEVVRGGSVVARLVPAARPAPVDGIDRQQAQAAADRIRNRAAQFKAGTFDWSVLKRDRDEGRE